MSLRLNQVEVPWDWRMLMWGRALNLWKNEDFENRIITETSPLPVFQTNLFAQFKAKEKALIQWGYDKEQESITNQVFDFAWTTSQRKQDPAQLWRTAPFIWRVEKEKSERENKSESLKFKFFILFDVKMI